MFYHCLAWQGGSKSKSKKELTQKNLQSKLVLQLILSVCILCILRAKLIESSNSLDDADALVVGGADGGAGHVVDGVVDAAGRVVQGVLDVVLRVPLPDSCPCLKILLSSTLRKLCIG